MTPSTAILAYLAFSGPFSALAIVLGTLHRDAKLAKRDVEAGKDHHGSVPAPDAAPRHAETRINIPHHAGNL